MAEVRQGPRTLGPAMKFLEELIRAEELTHGGNPIARWMFGNLEVKIDENENARPMKGKGRERIDGIAALLNAIDRGIRTGQPPAERQRQSGGPARWGNSHHAHVAVPHVRHAWIREIIKRYFAVVMGDTAILQNSFTRFTPWDQCLGVP